MVCLLLYLRLEMYCANCAVLVSVLGGAARNVSRKPRCSGACFRGGGSNELREPRCFGACLGGGAAPNAVRKLRRESGQCGRCHCARRRIGVRHIGVRRGLPMPSLAGSHSALPGVKYSWRYTRPTATGQSLQTQQATCFGISETQTYHLDCIPSYGQCYTK